MNTSIKLSRENLSEFQNILTMMFHFNLERIDHVQYWNIGNILQRIQRMNFRSSMDRKTSYTVSINPQESKCVLELITMSQTILEKSPYFDNMMRMVCDKIHHQWTENEHSMKILTSKINQQNQLTA